MLSFGITTTNDQIAEGNETFSLNLAGGAGVGVDGPSSLTTTITDTNRLSIELAGPRSLTEGQRSQPYSLSLGQSGLGVGQLLQLQLGLTSGSAQIGADLSQLGFDQLTLPTGLSVQDRCTLADGTLSFKLANTGPAALAPGARLLSFQLNPLADRAAEGVETFQVRAVLEGPTTEERMLESSIVDGDTAALAMRGPASVREGSSTGFYRVRLQKAALGQGQRLQVTLGLTGRGGASLSQDYEPLSATDVQLAPGLTIASSRQQANGGLILQLVNERSRSIPVGASLLQFRVRTVADELIENGEAIEVTLGSRSAAVIPGQSKLLTAIVDTSKPPVVPPPDGGGDGDGSGGGGSPEPPLRRETNGANGPDVLTGNELDNIIHGGRSGDLLSGGGGSNVFRFRLSDGLSQSDVITDFRPGSDTIRLEGVPRDSLAFSAFGGKTSLSGADARSAFQVVDALAGADRSRAVFVYARLSGELAYNANGSDPGLGRGGGVIATLPVLLPFQASDIQLVYGS